MPSLAELRAKREARVAQEKAAAERKGKPKATPAEAEWLRRQLKTLEKRIKESEAKHQEARETLKRRIEEAGGAMIPTIETVWSKAPGKIGKTAGREYVDQWVPADQLDLSDPAFPRLKDEPERKPSVRLGVYSLRSPESIAALDARRLATPFEPHTILPPDQFDRSPYHRLKLDVDLGWIPNPERQLRWVRAKADWLAGREVFETENRLGRWLTVAEELVIVERHYEPVEQLLAERRAKAREAAKRYYQRKKQER